MRSIAIPLVIVGSLGIMALGGRAIAADRNTSGRHASRADSAAMVATPAAVGKIWYGGTLAPVIVQVVTPQAKAVKQRATCPRTGN